MEAVVVAQVDLRPSPSIMQRGVERAKQVELLARRKRFTPSKIGKKLLDAKVLGKEKRRGKPRIAAAALMAAGKALHMKVTTHCYDAGKCEIRPGGEGDGDMIQCAICKCWYHQTCAKTQRDLDEALACKDLGKRKFRFECGGCREDAALAE